MSFFKNAWSRFAPALGIALFFVPLVAQASMGIDMRSCNCSSDYPPLHFPPF